jgi:hypothetical protein
MQTRAFRGYRRLVPDIWFVAGVALGTIVTGFCAFGSFERGSDSVRRRSWIVEHAARRRPLVASRAVSQPATEGALSKAS